MEERRCGSVVRQVQNQPGVQAVQCGAVPCHSVWQVVVVVQSSGIAEPSAAAGVVSGMVARQVRSSVVCGVYTGPSCTGGRRHGPVKGRMR